MHIPSTNVKDKLTWKFTSHGEYSVKTTTWTNNDLIHPYPKAEFIN